MTGNAGVQPANTKRRFTGVVFRVVLLMLLLPCPDVYGAECACKHGKNRARLECQNDYGCWFLLFGEGPEMNGLSQCIDSGREAPTGTQALYTSVTGKLEQVTLEQALSAVTKNTRLSVQILGDKARRVSLQYKERPLQLVLLDLQRISGVRLETTWLPELREGDVFSFCARGRAGKVGLLLYALTGVPIEVSPEKFETPITLELNSTTVQQAVEEMRRILGPERQKR